ncbi:hypothetical protein T02_2533 [Trichinella nativa]|uniref:Uncharacterized protein n=1 Tax=Trichinella nativa TaxID=6335 RepID=A0A0V1LPN1_9BILA|nr:hypothetical protein T02_2533 [Trichinella nativa]
MKMRTSLKEEFSSPLPGIARWLNNFKLIHDSSQWSVADVYEWKCDQAYAFDKRAENDKLTLYVSVSNESAHSMGKKFERNAENKNGQQVFDEKQLTKKHLPHLRIGNFFSSCFLLLSQVKSRHIDCDGNMKTDSCECPLEQCVRLQKHQIERTK